MDNDNRKFDDLASRLDNPEYDNAVVSKKSGRAGKVAVICIIAVAVLLILGIGVKTVIKDKSAITPANDYIAVIDVNGSIQTGAESVLEGSSYNHKWTLDKIDALIKDDKNKGIFMRVDSPGGSVIVGDELYFKLKSYKEQTGRPIYTYFGSMAASGGYYISANTDKILANRNCWTGSIGVTTGTMYDFTGLMEKLGIKAFTITSGKNKSMGSSFEEMTDEQKEIMQNLIDEAYEQFLDIVCEGRGLEESKVRPIADGRILSAKQALDANLIDGICSEEEALAMMKEDNDLGKCEVKYLAPESKTSIMSYFSTLVGRGSSELSEYKALLELMQTGNYYTVSYMSSIRK